MRRAALLAAAAAVAGWIALVPPAPRPPSCAQVRDGYRPSDVRLLDHHGEVLHELRRDETRRRLAWTPLAEVSPALVAALPASEDRRFHRHGGVDARALVAAVWQRATSGARRGASTVTMQLATLLDADLRRAAGVRALVQKWRQMRAAWALERDWSKAEILETYLNLVTFRGELVGVAAASSVLFGKAPHGLTAGEAVVLAGLVRAPNAGHEAVVRRAAALGGTATSEEIVDAARRALDAPAGVGPRVALAPHVAERLLEPGTTAPVSSTLDAALQRVAAETLHRQLTVVRERRVWDGAVLVADNATGDVLAYVGGSAELSSARHVDGVRARRQAGSALKPFLYGLALDRRLLTPASLVEDTPLEVPVAGGLYRPQNYDEQFRGLVTVRTALASSLNVPAVRTLGLVGAEALVEQLRALGLEGLGESGDWYGPALALGSADVSLWELVNAYRALANGGVWTPLRLAPDEPAGAARRVYSAEAAFLVSHVLADRESRSATFGLENPLATRFWTAVKTGTSKEMRDNWCVGYSRRYTAGVWVGNFSGAPMHDVSGTTGAAPVWLELMHWLHRDEPSAPPEPPPDVLARTIAFPRDLEPERVEWFLAGTEPEGSVEILAVPRPHIRAPTAGATIALDPDIPRARQRVLLEADGGHGLRWRLDGADLGPATAPRLWEPRPGRHALELVDGAGRTLDRVAFRVRGIARRG